MGAYECMGVYKHTGGVQMYGGIWMLPKLTTPMPASNAGTSYLKLNSYA